MKPRHIFSAFAFLFFAAPLQAQQPVIPPGDKEPFLRLEAGGPTTFVTSLAFSPDGKMLYAGGFDKVVRVWRLRSGEFVPARRAYRVPIGPGLDGAINALAVSPDGDWLAVAGMGIIRGGAGFRRPGLVLFQDSIMTREMWKDQGTIYVFNTRTGSARPLRGHLGPVLALAFAEGHGKPPLLVSAAQERDTDNKKFVGGLRLWDLSRAKDQDAYVTGRWGLALPALGTRPGLAAWHTGKNRRQLMVAIAWGNGKLRLWDVEEEEGLWTADDGRYNNTAVFSPALRQAITTSFRGRSGRLQAWDIPSGERMQADADRHASFDAEKEVYYFPRALTLLSSRPGGDPDHAAVVLRVPARDEEYRLRLLNLNPDRFGTMRADKVLWKGGRGGADLPVVTAAAGGRYLAVAGNKDHEIVIYRIADLLKGRGEMQRLRSVGATLRDLAFVTNGRKELGLWLGEEPRKAAGKLPPRLPDHGLIFDFVRRSLLFDGEGWQIAAPAAGGWEVQARVAERDKIKQPVRWSFSVRRAGVEQQRITLKALLVTDYALLPPTKPWNVPILAVASLDDKVQPWLYLYNAASGEQIRRYTGHTDRIRALAFSPDGRLLASAADDQTVSVWSLTNLTRFLGQRGMLLGVGVKAVDGGLAVAHLDRDCDAAKVLHRDDVIEGLVEAKKLRRFKSPLDFYDAISLLKPGRTVRLGVRGKGEVAVKLGHAIDDWKPLLTLFVTRADRPAVREWVGWNPHGHYDASDRKTERLIGWHFNTGQPDAPAKFALADQYRRDYYRLGILKHLVAQGSLSPALRAWDKEDRAKRLPRPKMNVWSDPARLDPAGVDGRGETIVRLPQDSLTVAIDDFPLRKVESVSWQVNGGALRSFDPAAGREWSADLSNLPWKAGDKYTIRVVLRSREVESPAYARQLILHYQPPAAVAVKGAVPVPAKPVGTVEWREPPADAVFYDDGAGPPEVTVRCRLLLADDRKAVAATVLVNGKEVAHRTEAPDILTARFTPQPQENRIQVRLRRRGQPAAVAADVRVRCLRPPRILKTEKPALGKKPMTELVAVVDSALPLDRESVEAEINDTDIPAGRVRVKKDGAHWKVRLKDVALRPGPNEAQLRVRNAEAGCRVPGVWQFDFKPPAAPPLVEILDPSRNVTVTDGEVTVRFRVKSASPLRRVELVREGAVSLRRAFDVVQKAAADGYIGWQAVLPLAPGENRLRVEAVNDGGAEQVAVVVNFLHLPVRLVIDSLGPRGGQPVMPRVLSGGSLQFPKMPEGQLSLAGRVVWDRAGDEYLKKTKQVRVYVNGFQQRPVPLRSAMTGRDRERAFTAEMLLNQAKSNLIEVALPDLPQEAGNRSEFRVDCGHPAAGQRLHLLIVGVGEKSEQELLDQALAAVRARRDSRGRYRAPAFDDLRVYGPLTGYVTPEQVFTQLCLIKKTIDLLTTEGSSNDVVWVYYKGAESVGRQGHFFLTSVSDHTKDLRWSGVTCDGLANFFAETLGAQLLLLDVTPVPAGERLAPGEAPDKVAKWPVDSNVGVTRYRKLKGLRNSALLLTDLRELMPRANTWGAVVKMVREKTDHVEPGTLLVFQRLRESLEGLTVGATP